MLLLLLLLLLPPPRLLLLLTILLMKLNVTGTYDRVRTEMLVRLAKQTASTQHDSSQI